MNGITFEDLAKAINETEIECANIMAESLIENDVKPASITALQTENGPAIAIEQRFGLSELRSNETAEYFVEKVDASIFGYQLVGGQNMPERFNCLKSPETIVENLTELGDDCALSVLVIVNLPSDVGGAVQYSTHLTPMQADSAGKNYPIPKWATHFENFVGFDGANQMISMLTVDPVFADAMLGAQAVLPVVYFGSDDEGEIGFTLMVNALSDFALKAALLINLTSVSLVDAILETDALQGFGFINPQSEVFCE